MDNISNIGSHEKIIKSIEMALSLNHDDAKKVFDYLAKTYHVKSVEFGYIDRMDEDVRALIFENGQYYINMPKALLGIIAILLDITLTRGVVSGICAILGIQMQALYSINQHEGEVCLLREHMRNKEAINAEKFSYLYGNECINNELCCKYRKKRNYCGIRKSNIDAILKRFEDIGII